MNQPKIYFDMDGVLANFGGRVLELTGNSFIPGNVEQWEVINQYDHFFLDLAPIEPMVKLVRFLVKVGYDVGILSTTPVFGNVKCAKADKENWCFSHLSVTADVIIVDHPIKKQEYARPGAILIDDSVRNISQWRIRGGTGIIHTSYSSTLSELNEMLHA